jgi:hypothetical protein
MLVAAAEVVHTPEVVVEVVHMPIIMIMIIIRIIKSAIIQMIIVITVTNVLKRMITSIVSKDVRLIFISRQNK